MACTVKELRKFLKRSGDDDVIGIDEGGLTLIVLAKDGDDPEKCTEFDNGDGTVLASAYFEIGGIPLDDEDDDEDEE